MTILIALTTAGSAQDYIKGKLFMGLAENSTLDYSFNGDRENPNSQLTDVTRRFSISRIHIPFKTQLTSQVYLVEFDLEQPVNPILVELGKLSDVAYVERVPDYKSFYTTGDLDSNQWYLNTIQAELAWDLSTGNAAVTVAIVDDAVLLNHADLSGNIWVNPGEMAANGIDDDNNGYIDDVNGWDVSDNDNDPNPPSTATNSSFTHGTHCAGIAAAATGNSIGIASIGFNSSIIAVKCKPDALLGSSLPDAYLGVDYAIASNADIISMSWGGYAYSITYQSLFDAAYNSGIVLIAAAGNSNTGAPMYPASYNNVISIGATDINDQKAAFSNYGATIDVMAPGVGILSCLAGSSSSYGNLSGTSMASPHVAGSLALVLSAIKKENP